MEYLPHFGRFILHVWETWILDFNLNLNFNYDSDQPRISNSKSCDMAILTWDYCSLIIRTSQKVHTFFYKIGQSRDTLTADKTCMHTRKDRRDYMWNCCKRGDHLGIMLVRIVLHVRPMPVIQEFELIELNSFTHYRISLHFIHSSTKKGSAGGIIN